MTDREPDHARALDALEWAACRAEGNAPGQLDVVATMADYLAAADLARPDLRKRLDRVMMAEDAESGLDALLECGALEALLPPVAGLVGFGDGEWRHKDVWKHTKQVVGQATPKLEVRWAALLHDIGKVKTRSISADGQVHFFGHAEVGARMFDKLQKRMALFTPDSALEREIRFLVLHHLRASHYSPSWTDSAVRRFAREMGGYLEDLFCLSRADITTKRAERKRKGTKQIDDLMVRVSALAAEDAERPILPTGLGNALMESFQIPPSKRLGDIKRNVENAVKAGLVLPYLECEDYVAFLREHPALLS